MSVIMKPTNVIIANLGVQPNGPVHRFFTNTCYKHMDKYVPKRDGELRNVVTILPNAIIYDMPYAHAQYIGFTKGPVTHYTTPGTGPYWDKRMVSAEMQDVVKEVQDYMRR